MQELSYVERTRDKQFSQKQSEACAEDSRQF